MKKKIYDIREKLYRESVLLREEANKTEDYNKSVSIRRKQDVLYNKWKFYDNIIKADDKIKGDT